MLEPTYCVKLARYWLRCLSFKYWVREAAENIGTGKTVIGIPPTTIVDDNFRQWLMENVG
jgi:hypothetical protein